MRYIASLFLSSIVALAGNAGTPPAGACSLISSDAIQKVFGEAVTNAKPDSQVAGKVMHSNCFYSLTTFTNSISVSVTSASGRDRDAARELWKRSFHGESDDKDADRDGKSGAKSEEEEAMAKAAPLSNLGDEAFWVHSFVGNLYVLKGHSFLRISIGGKLSDEERQQRARVLAAAALKNVGRVR